MAHDLLDGLAQIRTTFKRAQLEPPTTLLLADHEQGMRLLMELRQMNKWVVMAGDPNLGKPVEMADGSIWMEVKVMGFNIRWPANRYATPDGSWSWV